MEKHCTELERLNRDTFRAEAKEQIGQKQWDQFLRSVLADDFAIRRSDKTIPNQDRETMIAWIAERPVAERRLLEDEVVSWCDDGTLGVVTCPVTMVREGTVHRYQNVKVFRKEAQQQQGHWQCVYWQVTEAPATAALTE
jgi:hypothetical protein